MTKKQYSLMLVLALVACLVGGVLSSQFLMGQPAFAEKDAKAQKVIEAQQFRVVDKNGITRAILGLNGTLGLVVLSLNDEYGVTRLEALVSPYQSWFGLFDKNKNTRIALSVIDDDNIAALAVKAGLAPKECGNMSLLASGKDWMSIKIADADCKDIWKAP